MDKLNDNTSDLFWFIVLCLHLIPVGALALRSICESLQNEGPLFPDEEEH